MTTSDKPASPSKKPTHLAYHIRENAKQEEFWTRIGCAWPHSDGQGFNVELETVPLNGRVTLRVASTTSN